MKFGPVPLADAEGAILAHSHALSAGRLRKGTQLTAADVSALREEGVREVIVARLDPDDLHEDAAARRIAEALVPDPAAQGLRLTQAATGRVNIHAETAGVFTLDTAAVHRLNRINPIITLATLRPFRRVAAGEMVATVKIIAYAAPKADVDQAAEAAGGALRVAAPIYTSAALVETSVTNRTPSAKGRDALALRLARMGAGLAPRVVVQHEAGALAAALAEVEAEVVFILTASATSDIADVAPSAVRKAGGEVTHFGMPVDPGNLLFLGRLGAKPVIGLPGCARSPALNGADWVLERVLCGLEVTADDIAAMGIGGLLKEIPIRPRPREG